MERNISGKLKVKSGKNNSKFVLLSTFNIPLLTIFVFLSGCAIIGIPYKTTVVHRMGMDDEIYQKIKSILEGVEDIARQHDLDYFGRSTLKESVEIMELGAKASPVLVERLKMSKNWKFRFWIVDMLGYIPHRDNIVPLIEVIEDCTEEEIVRLRACESLKELNYLQAVEHLLISMDMIENDRVKEEINETIEFLR